ncbi:MAG: alpha/beta hydrolase [Parachlamydiales bacterium]|jgi:pimeloyl-ACP methyl ester carboxylesterase
MKQKLRLLLLTVAMTFSHMFATGTETKQNSYLEGKSLGYSSLVDIGDGRKMYLECQGTGSPTVVLISGRTDRSDIWKTVANTAASGLSVFPAVAQFTRVCSYDRPGTVKITGNHIESSRSTSVPQPTTPKNAVADLHKLLTAAKVPGPYILVGHSYGGLIARLYADTYSNEVAGIVLIDTLTEFMYDSLPQNQQALWIRLNSHYSPDLDKYTTQEKTDFVPSFEQLRDSPASQPLPAIILTSDQTYDFKSLISQGILPPDTPVNFGPIVFQAHLLGQKRLTNVLKAKQITNTHAGHYIQTEQPQLVIEAIGEVVEQVRNNK